MNIANIVDIEVDGVNTRDYPDFSDAYISYAVWKDTGKKLSEEELDTLNDEYSDFVYDAVMDSIY